MSWVWDHSTSGGTDRLVLLAISDSANDDGSNAWPSIATIARKANVSSRTVQRCVQNLIELGELEVEFGTGRQSSRYRVIMKRPDEQGRQIVTPESPGEPDQGRQDDTPPLTNVTPLPRQDDTPGASDCHPTPDAGVTQPILEPSKTQEPSSSGPAAPDPATKPGPDDNPSALVVELCNLLADKIEANGSKRPTVGKGWYAACRLMIEQDKREPDKIRNAITWCQADEFWRANILSMPKLREKYDQMRLSAERAGRPAGRPQASVSDARERRRQMRWANGG
jgi:hypothetical protein